MNKNMENTQKRKNKKSDMRILKFDAGEERLDESIQKRLDEGDCFTALRLANRRNEFFEPTPDSYAVQADIYEMAEANTQALKTWYRFLNIADEDSLAEAYEGLAVNYMNLGKEGQAAYYYNLLLRVDDELSEESKMDIVEMFSKPKRSMFKVVYPPERADYTDTIEQGLHALKESDFPTARSEFEKVEKGAAQYRTAQNLIAVTCLLQDKKDEAKEICQRLIAEDENDVQAYTTYAAVLGQEDNRVEAEKIARKLCSMETKDTDETYKIATVCCENGLHAEALEKFIQLEEEIGTDKTLFYFKAVSAYKSGNLKLAVDTFEKLLAVYPQASVARYYYDILRYYAENSDKQDVVAPELSYFYRVPQTVRENYCELLYFLKKLKRAEAETVKGNPQVSVVLNWCFDEMDGTDADLQLLGVAVAVHCGCEQFLQNVLLDPDVLDAVKINALNLIARENEACEYGLVVYHIFRRVKFYHIKTGVKKRRKFLNAYADVYAKFAVISDNHAQRIRAAAELLYNCLSIDGTLNFADNEGDISCVIYMLAGIKEAGSTPEAAAKLFGASAENVASVLASVERIAGEALKEHGSGKKESVLSQTANIAERTEAQAGEENGKDGE